MNKQLTIAQQHRLTKLARDIRELHDSTESLAKLARDKCNEAVAEALLLGQALNEVKKIVGHGNWLPWVKENCAKVSERTAQKYMRLANTNHGSDLEAGNSLRQAYIAAGIIPAKATPAKPSTPAALKTQPKPVLNVSATVETQTAAQPIEPETAQSDVVESVNDTVRFLLYRINKMSEVEKRGTAAALYQLTPFICEYHRPNQEAA